MWYTKWKITNGYIFFSVSASCCPSSFIPFSQIPLVPLTNKSLTDWKEEWKMLEPERNCCFSPLCFMLGKLGEALEDRRSCLLVLPCFCHQEKALQQFYSELWCRVQSCLLCSSTVLTEVGNKKCSEESCVKIVTNFAAVLAITSGKYRTIPYAFNLFNKQYCIR